MSAPKNLAAAAVTHHLRNILGPLQDAVERLASEIEIEGHPDPAMIIPHPQIGRAKRQIRILFALANRCHKVAEGQEPAEHLDFGEAASEWPEIASPTTSSSPSTRKDVAP